MTKSVLLAGGSGLIGGFLLKDLLKQDVQVLMPLRNVTAWQSEHPSLAAQANLTLVSYDELWTLEIPIDAYFCALGTTRAKAGKEGLKKVDHDLVIDCAKFALENGAKLASVVSALGASSKSLFFYNRIKGQMEESLQALSFEQTHIWRPSLLIGERPEKRFLEELAGKFLHLSFWGGSQALPGKTVASAMLQAANKNTQTGVQFFNVANIKHFAAQSIKH